MSGNPPSGLRSARGPRLPSPAARILLSVFWIFLIALLPNRWWRWQAVPLVALGLLSWQWRVALRPLLRRLLLLWPFVGLIAAGLLAQPDWPLRIGNLVLKATLCLWVMHVLADVTPANDLARGLRQLRLPRLWVELFAFWSRYFAVLSGEWHRMRLARQARTFGWDRRRAWRDLTNSLGLLFVRAYERAEQIHHAMLARGYSWRESSDPTSRT